MDSLHLPSFFSPPPFSFNHKLHFTLSLSLHHHHFHSPQPHPRPQTYHFGGLHGEPDWTTEQLDVLSSLFERPPKKSKVKDEERPLPLPVPREKRFVPLPRRRLASRKLVDNFFSMRRDFPKKSQFLLKLAAEIHALPMDDNVCTQLDGYAALLIRGALSATIRELGHLGNPRKALEVFLWQERYPHLWPDDRTFCAILEVLAEEGEEENVWKLLGSLTQTPTKAFESAILGFLKSGSLEWALQVKDAAKQAGCALNQRVYAKLIYVASRKPGCTEIVLSLVDQLGSFPELKLKLEDCTAVMVACSKVGLYESVESLFQWWKSTGCQPNIVMFTTLMKARSKVGKHRKALSTYWEIEEVGCALDLPAFSVMLDICVETGDTRKALQLFGQMKDSGIYPASDVYNMLLKLCCKDGMYRKAQGLLKEMQMMGLATNGEIKEMIFLHSLSSASQ